MHDRGAVLRTAFVGLGLALAVLCAACTASGGHGSSAQPPSAGRPGATITVGSFNFPESILLAYIYADALAAKGLPVRVLPDLGTRELVEPALMTGLVQLVPEYTGSALNFISLGRRSATSDAAQTYRSLTLSAAQRGLVAARPAPAQDANAIVVTAATAARYHLRSIADLANVAQKLVFGGPPECKERADCLRGLERRYGLRLAFTPTDTGGPLTMQALVSGQIGVGLLFTTNPAIPRQHLVILADNRDLQPAENVAPLVRRSTMDRYGPRLLTALDAVSRRLTTPVLRSLNARVELDGLPARKVADEWLRAQALIPESQGVR